MQSTKIKRTKLNFVLSLINVVVTALVGILIPRFILTNYGSDVNGLTNSINQFIAYLSLFEAGIGVTATQALYKPIAENDTGSINSIITAMNKRYRKIGTIYLFALLSLSFLYPLIFLKNEIIGLNYISIFLCVFFSGLGNVVLFFIQGKYRILLSAEGKGYILSFIQTIITVVIACSKIVLINFGFSILWIFIATFGINLFQVVAIMIIIRSKYKWIDFSVKPSDISFKQSPYVFIGQISWLVFQNIDILLLTFFCDIKVVSVYSIYKLVSYNIGQLLDIPLNSSSFAFGQIFNTNLEKFKKLFLSTTILYYCLCFAIQAVVLWLYLPFLTLYTSGVTDAQYINYPLAILFVVVELLIFLRKPFLNVISYAGHFKSTTKQTIIEAVINLIVSISLVPFLGIYGVLIGTVVALVYRVIDLVFYVNRRLLNMRIKISVQIIFINIFSFVFAYFFLSFFANIQITSYYSFAKAGLFGVAISLYLSIILNFLFLKKYISFDFLKKNFGENHKEL